MKKEFEVFLLINGLFLIIFISINSTSALTHITDCTGLQNMKNNMAESYVLDNDIDCSGVNFQPIGNYDTTYNPFTGNLDGQNHKIFNLRIYSPSTGYSDLRSVGMYGFMTNTVVKNVGFENVDITGPMAGGIAGGCFNCSILNCYTKGSVRSNNGKVGGLLGTVGNLGATKITNSYSDTNLYKTQDFGQTGDAIGGLVGYAYATTITNSYFSGSISANVGYQGGLGGWNHGITYNGCYWDTQTSGQTSAGYEDGGSNSGATGLTTSAMHLQSSYAGWDFANVWRINNTFDYPRLRYECVPNTCSSLGKNCGSWSDGCGGTLGCGTCSGGCSQCNSSGGCSPKISGTVCRNSTGVCDIAETCDGISLNCPSNLFNSSSTICRSSAGPCDIAENCTGSSADCPLDLFKPATFVCRASNDDCDLAENCTGTNYTCSADVVKSNGTNCTYNSGLDALSPFLSFLKLFGINLGIKNLINGVCDNGVCVSSCMSQCNLSEQLRCDGGNSQTCSDYNSDGCLEWGGDVSCTFGCNASSGNCNGRSCINECTTSGDKRCFQNNSQTCGDYNSDECLEWEGDFNCLLGCNSSSGNCTKNLTNITPNITSISVSVTSDSATINWDTDINSSSLINYGTNISNINNYRNDSDFKLNHSITLTELASSTLFYYSITSCDVYASCTSSEILNFTTNSAPVNPPSGGGGNGGGGGSVAPSKKCTENWVCGNWSECINELRTRTCLDKNKCNNSLNKPIISAACSLTKDIKKGEPVVIINNKSYAGVIGEGWIILLACLIVIIAIIVLIIIIIILKKHRMRRTGKANRAKKELFINAVYIAKSARKKGMSEGEIWNLFKDKNWSDRDIEKIIARSRE